MLLLCILQSPDIYKMYIEELKDPSISSRDGAELIKILLEFSITTPSLFEEYKVNQSFSINIIVFFFFF